MGRCFPRPRLVIFNDFFVGARMADIQLQINVAQGAPPFDPALALRPANAVTIYGSPNDPIMAEVGAGASIVENNNASSYQFQLDETGYGRFSVAALDLGLRQTIVSAYVIGNEDNNTGGPANFGLYRIGERQLYGYAPTTHGAADGTSVCSAYVIVRPTQIDGGYINLTEIVAKVDGNAWLTSKPGQPQLDTIPLNGGGATINIADATAELVNLTVALPESPDGEFAKMKISFVAFPVLQSQFRAQTIIGAKGKSRTLPRGAGR
jgi:hypothetical protein